MASFYAELHLAGASYRVVQCQFACQQSTDMRGRVQAKVRFAPLQLVVDVPDDDALVAWAAAPHKPLAGEVIFYDATQRTALETIAFAAGECVYYGEQFASSATGNGAYVCQLTIAAASFELRAGGPAGSGAVRPTVASISPPAATAPLDAATSLATPVAAKPEYTLAEFTNTIWGADKVDSAIINQLYQTFNAAKASTVPNPHWAVLENLIRSTTYPNARGEIETLNGGWPPANGGVNKRLMQPAPPDKFDRYQKEVKTDAAGNPILGGTFTSPIPPSGAYDYEARALEGVEKDYDLHYEIEVLKPFPFGGEEATIIPWHGHTGNGIQTRMLFPPKDPATGDFPWDWKKLQREGYVRITYKKSPNGKFMISPDGSTAKIASI